MSATMRVADPTRWPAKALVLILAAATTMCGCSNATKPAPSAAGPSQQSATSAPATVEAPSIATSSPLPTGNVLRAPATVYSDCKDESDGHGNRAFNDEAQIFNPKTGENVPLPAPTIPAGQHLLESACTVGGDLDHIRVFYVITLSTPSSGLTPESRTSSIVSFDPFASGPPQTKPLPSDIDPETVREISPSKYGFFIRRENPNQSLADEFIGFDGTTLEKTFTIDGSGPLPLTHLNPSAIFIYYYGGQVRIYSAKDGHVLTDVMGSSQGGAPSSYPNGFVFFANQNNDRQHGFFNTEDNQLKAPFPSTGDMWANNFLALEEHALEVRDVVTNAVTFRREGPDFDGLHITNAYLAGKYLYLANDSDNPVIDITTAQKVSSGWTVRPTDVINEDWILVNEQDSGDGGDASCFEEDYTLACGSPKASLKYAPSGNYAGPWY